MVVGVCIIIRYLDHVPSTKGKGQQYCKVRGLGKTVKTMYLFSQVVVNIVVVQKSGSIFLFPLRLSVEYIHYRFLSFA